MELFGPLVALLAFPFLVGRCLPGQNWPVIIAVTLAFIVAVLWLERSGLWPQSWRTPIRRSRDYGKALKASRRVWQDRSWLAVSASAPHRPGPVGLFPHHRIEVAPVTAGQISKVGIEYNDRRTILTVVRGTVRVEGGGAVVLSRLYSLGRPRYLLAAHDRLPFGRFRVDLYGIVLY